MDVSHSNSLSISIYSTLNEIREVLVIRFSVFLMIIYIYDNDKEKGNAYFKLDLVEILLKISHQKELIPVSY